MVPWHTIGSEIHRSGGKLERRVPQTVSSYFSLCAVYRQCVCLTSVLNNFFTQEQFLTRQLSTKLKNICRPYHRNIRSKLHIRQDKKIIQRKISLVSELSGFMLKCYYMVFKKSDTVLVSTYVVCERLSVMQRHTESVKANFVLKFLSLPCSGI